MHADICASDDSVAMTRFKSILQARGAKVIQEHNEPGGTDVVQVEIRGQILNIFTDILSTAVDVEGPEEVVQSIVTEMNRFPDEPPPRQST